MIQKLFASERLAWTQENPRRIEKVLRRRASTLLALVVGLPWKVGGCSAIPRQTPIEKIINYTYNPSGELFVLFQGKSDDLAPQKYYRFFVTAQKRGPREYVLWGHVDEFTHHLVFITPSGLALSNHFLLTNIEPGSYTFVDGATEKVVGTIDTSAPSPKYPYPS